MIASLALFVIATTDKVVVAVVIIYIGITTCSLLNAYYSSKLWGSLQNLSRSNVPPFQSQSTHVHEPPPRTYEEAKKNPPLLCIHPKHQCVSTSTL